MNNPFHTRLIDLKVEISRIPQNTIAVLGHALAENGTVADAVAIVKASAQDLGKFGGALEAAQQKVSDLELRLTQVEARFECLAGLALLEDALAHWADDHSDRQKECLRKLWQAITEKLRALIAEAGDDEDWQNAWQAIHQELPHIQQHKERVGPLRTGIRKLRWALLPLP